MTEVLYTDEREPTQDLPLFYLERAYFVRDADEDAATRMLRECLPGLADTVADRPAGRFVRLAAFDHHFEDAPERDPIAVVTWRDWADDALEARAPLSQDPGRFSVPPALGESPVPGSDGEPIDLAPPSSGKPPRPDAKSDGVSTATMIAAPAAAPSVADAPDTSGIGAKSVKDPVAEGAEDKAPKKKKRKRGQKANASLASKGDLIGDLFERLHELHFQADMLEGADFVLGVIADVFPCAGVLLHVFDIDQREFVIVRAVGPNASSLLMHKTVGGDPFFHALMKRHRSLALNPVPEPQDKLRERWEELGLEPSSVLCGPVVNGGRHLGVIELANPEGEPFNAKKAKALDYVCGQFAEFLAQRPIVIEGDEIRAEPD